MMIFNSYIPLPEQNHISIWMDLVIAMLVAMAYINSRKVYIHATEYCYGLRTN